MPVSFCCFSINYRFVVWYLYKNRFNSSFSKCTNIIELSKSQVNLSLCKNFNILFNNIDNLDFSEIFDNCNYSKSNVNHILFMLNSLVLFTKRSVTRSTDYDSLNSNDKLYSLFKLKLKEFLLSSCNLNSFNKSTIHFDFINCSDYKNPSLQRNTELRNILLLEGGILNE